MSNRRRPRRFEDRLHDLHRGQATAANRDLRPGETYLIVPALHTNRHLPDVETSLRQQTHDLLYEQAGAGEIVTGVWWTIHYGSQARDRYTRAMAVCGLEPATPEELEAAGVQFEDNPELLLVCAWAIGIPPATNDTPA